MYVALTVNVFFFFFFLYFNCYAAARDKTYLSETLKTLNYNTDIYLEKNIIVCPASARSSASL